MNTINIFRKLALCGLLAAAGLFTSPAKAASLTWNDAGTGAWNTSSTQNWSTGGSFVVWSNSNEAVFGSGSNGTYSVNLATGPTASNLVFNNSTYTLTSATARTLTLSATSNTIVINSGATATFGSSVTISTPNLSRNAVIAGSGTLNLDSGSRLNYNGAGTGSTLSVNATTVNLNAGAELNTWMISGTTGSALFLNGNLNVNGGKANVYGTLGIGQTDSSGVGALTINSGTVTASSNSGIRFGAATAASQGGAVNLNGGTLQTSKFSKGATVTNSILNFNGGTLVATAASSAFITGLDRVNVRDGGAKIDNAGFDLTISQGLLHSNIGGDAATDGGLTKSGSGTLTLSSASTYTGPTVVNGGKMVLGASGSTSSLSVSAGAELRVLTTAGHMPSTPVNIAGTFGCEQYQFGAVTMASTGRLEAGTAGGGLVVPSFASFSGTTGATLSIQLGKTTTGTDPLVNTDFERITVRNGGSVLLNNMTLDLQTTANTGNIEEGDLFFIVYNQGSNAVQGIFAGLAQGSIFEWENKIFQISYTAHWSGNYATSKMTDGNDVALLAVPEPSTWAFLLGGFGLLFQFQRARKRVGTR